MRSYPLILQLGRLESATALPFHAQILILLLDKRAFILSYCRRLWLVSYVAANPEALHPPAGAGVTLAEAHTNTDAHTYVHARTGQIGFDRYAAALPGLMSKGIARLVAICKP